MYPHIDSNIIRVLLLLSHIDTDDRTWWAQRIGTSHAGGGCETVQKRNEGVRGRYAQRTYRGIGPGPKHLVHGRITRPELRRRSHTGLPQTGSQLRRSCRMHRCFQATVVCILDVNALARLVHGFVQGSSEYHLLRHA